MFIGSNEVLLIISMNVQDDKTGSEIEQDIKELKLLIQQKFPNFRFEMFIEVYEF